MDDIDVIEAYVRELEEALRRAGRPTSPLVEEARAHLFEDAADIARAEGCGDEEAARRALTRFGAVAEVVAASRQHAHVAAARVARWASVVMLAAMALVTINDFTPYDGGMGWPLLGDWTFAPVWLALVTELGFVTWALWRALAGGAAPRWLTTALRLNGAFAGALLVAYVILGLRRLSSFPHFGVWHVLALAPPLWVLMCLQSFAGLSALGRRTRTETASG